MIKHIRKNIKVVACFMAVNLMAEIVTPTIVYALTGGPSQPEVQSFEPAGTSEMVDLFSGDFNYNIPLLDVDGYPINIAYHSGIGMDDEASWVGLGWNINPGAINRSMRGLPDDFKGDEIKKEFNIRPNRTYRLATDVTSLEIFGMKPKKLLKSLNAQFGIKYNNYKGVGYDFGISLSKSIGPFRGNLGANYSSDGGFGVEPSISFNHRMSNKEKSVAVGGSMSIGTAYNSRSGVKSLNYGGGFSTNKLSQSLNFGGEYSFGTQTWVPNISMPMRSISTSLNITVGADLFGTHPNLNFTGSYSVQNLMNKTQTKKAYGYYFEHEKGENDDVLLDFNREKDGSFNENSTNLPLTNHTYDIMSVTGHGIGGSFRAKRSDIAAIHDDRSNATSAGGSVGVELGAGNIAHVGVDVKVNYNRSTSGLWKSGNQLLSIYDFTKNSYPEYEPAYFKSGGDIVPVDKEFHNRMFNDEAVRPHILGKSSATKLYQKKTGVSSEEAVLPLDRQNQNLAAKRAIRNQTLTFLNGLEALSVGLDKTINSVPLNQEFVEDEIPQIKESRIGSTDKKLWHMSELSVLKEDGMRYIYGIPAYNTKTIEKSFNIGEESGTDEVCESGQATYSTLDKDNTNQNSKGLDYFYSSVETPAYAHSFLLTGVVSPDYVDILNDGITDDDLGTAVKFNYSKVHDNYRWRVPYNLKSANYSEGLKSNSNDDKGSYSYGEKEIWLTHSIEGKNHVAIFKIQQREDGLGVHDEDGGKDISQRQYQIDEINLYAKQDLIRFGNAATPIKTVHFEYDYSLCPNVENNTGTPVMVEGIDINANKGKLTLKKIYFTYGTSGKGRLNAYNFNYSAQNPDYHLLGHDAWGNYKTSQTDCCGDGANISNADFPYVEQNKVNADFNASAWTLTEIQLPSGGKIIVNYESDDYAYVQNRQAMQMLQLEAFGYKDEFGNPVKTDGRVYNDDGHFELVFFKLQEPIIGANTSDQLKHKYLKDMIDLQFTVFSDINNKGNYEYVKGYAEIISDDCGVIENGTIGWVKMKEVKLGDKSPFHKNDMVSPVARTVWNFAKMNAPHLVYPYSPSDAGDVKPQLLSLLAICTDVFRMVEGFNHSLETQNFGKYFNKNKSWVRLLNPNKKKLGGGARVKTIKMNDNWTVMGSGNLGATDEEYGQEYDYSMEEKQSDGTMWTISSGVASYEPGIGRDENPFVQPRVITIENKMVPNTDILQEEPYGESFYPGASVGYRKVTVKSLTKAGVERTGTGKQVSEFYTAYDYPVIITETKIQKNNQKDKPFWSFIYNKKEESASASQGYVIELNDMHGKPKAQWSYTENGIEPISGSSFIYQDKIKNGVKCLDNKVLLLDKDGTITENEIGVDLEMVNDFRENIDESISGGVEVNTESMVLFVAPLIIPPILPSIDVNVNNVHTAVTTKVINRMGIVKETRAFQEGSMIKTSNLLYDNETGQLLLTSVQNEFKDNIYSFTQPAHWAYEGMGQAYKNIQIEFRNVRIESDKIILPDGLITEDYLFPGDEVLLTSNFATMKKAYVFEGTDGVLNFINSGGEPFPTSPKKYKIKVIRSGRRNLHKSAIGSVITKTNPLVQTGSTYNLVFTDILNTESMEYSDQWQTFVDYMPNLACDSLSLIAEDILTILNGTINESDLFKVRFDILHNELELEFPGITLPVIPNLYKNISGSMTSISSFEYGETDLFLKYGALSTVPFEPFNPASSHFEKYKPINLATSPPFVKKFFVYNDMSTTLQDIFDDSPLRTRANEIFAESSCYYLDHVHRHWGDENSPTSINLLTECCPINLNIPNISSFREITEFVSMRRDADGTVYFTLELLMNDNSIETIEVVSQPTTYLDNLGVEKECYNLFECPPDCYTVFEERKINPYRTGLSGNWHPLKAFKYLGEREYNPNNKDPRNDGVYSNYLPFWTYNGTEEAYTASGTNSNKWVWTSQTTKYTPFGNEIETKDALGRYSSALFGYNFTTPIAVASNSKVGQIAYDGFEDYSFINQYASYWCAMNHFNFEPTLRPWDDSIALDDNIRHTGNFSLRIEQDVEATILRPLNDVIQSPISSNPDIERTVKPADDVGIFKPETGTYIVSAWIKEDRTADQVTYDNGLIRVKFLDALGAATILEFKPSGKIVEGWQRIEAQFDVPSDATEMYVSLVASDDVTTWFDDVRVHPVDGNMVSYAYDSRTMKLLGQLDENNYATIYEYDAEGTLIRVKKETEKGIKTLKETRNHFYKQ